jgi:hypothetical protein
LNPCGGGVVVTDLVSISVVVVSEPVFSFGGDGDAHGTVS